MLSGENREVSVSMKICQPEADLKAALLQGPSWSFLGQSDS